MRCPRALLSLKLMKEQHISHRSFTHMDDKTLMMFLLIVAFQFVEIHPDGTDQLDGCASERLLADARKMRVSIATVTLN